MPGTSRSGRKKDPTALKLLKGKKADNDAEPAPIRTFSKCPPAPRYLNERAKRIFNRVCRHLDQMQILSEADEAIIGLYATAYDQFLTLTEQVKGEKFIIERSGVLKKNGQIAKGKSITRGADLKKAFKTNGKIANPLFTMWRETRIEVQRYASELGLTPVARSRVKIVGGKQNPFKQRLLETRD